MQATNKKTNMENTKQISIADLHTKINAKAIISNQAKGYATSVTKGNLAGVVVHFINRQEIVFDLPTKTGNYFINLFI